MTETFARMLVVLFGVVLLLFALGQAFGLNLLGVVTSALASQTGQWLLVAFLAVVLIVAALGGFQRYYY